VGSSVTGAFVGLGVGLVDGGGGAVVVLVVVVVLVDVVVVVVVVAAVVVVVVPPPEFGSSPQSHKGGLLSQGQYCDS